LLPGGPIPRPNWLAEQPATPTEQIADKPNQEPEAANADHPRGHYYDGFPLVEETRTDGWCYAAITEFNEPECHPNGCESGSGYVEAPDGSRIGLVWSTGAFAAEWVCPLGDEGPGLFEVPFPKPVKNLHDLVECFRSVVPQLQMIHAEQKNR
jgi:hypothetical protein